MESVEKLVGKKISAVHVVDLASSNNHNLHVKVLQSSPNTFMIILIMQF